MMMRSMLAGLLWIFTMSITLNLPYLSRPHLQGMSGQCLIKNSCSGFTGRFMHLGGCRPALITEHDFY